MFRRLKFVPKHDLPPQSVVLPDWNAQEIAQVGLLLGNGISCCASVKQAVRRPVARLAGQRPPQASRRRANRVRNLFRVLAADEEPVRL